MNIVGRRIIHRNSITEIQKKWKKRNHNFRVRTQKKVGIVKSSKERKKDKKIEARYGGRTRDLKITVCKSLTLYRLS